jgi:hypothetical protein
MKKIETEIINYSDLLQNYKTKFSTNNSSIINDWNLKFNIKNKTTLQSLTEVISSSTDLIQLNRNLFGNISFSEINDWYIAVKTDNEKHIKTGHNFNIFQLLKDKFGFTIQETMHSKLIKFLLDTHEIHGQGNFFLLEFLKILNIESPEIGTWFVTAEEGRIDVLLERKFPQSIIIIENKSNWAKDQQNQLYRYWYQAIFQKTKEHSNIFYDTNTNKYKIIYLVPNGNKNFEQHSILKPVEYQGIIYDELPEKVPMEIMVETFDELIQIWLNKCLSILPENNHRIREYIIQYQAMCNNL